MNHVLRGGLLAAALLWSGAAAGATFNLSYTTEGGDILTAQIVGTLRTDMNTVDVTAVNGAAFNGATGPALPLIDSLSNFDNGSGLPAVLALDATLLDLIACADATCTDGFAFETSGAITGDPGVGIYLSGISFGDDGEFFEPDRYALEPANAVVPLPAGAVLMLTAIAALGATRLRV